MRSLRWLLVLAVFVAQTAAALATIEFMKMKPTDQYEYVKPLMLKFLRSGYKKVPDNEFTLISAIEKLAYEKGYTYQNIEEVALEAAIRLGMYR